MTERPYRQAAPAGLTRRLYFYPGFTAVTLVGSALIALIFFVAMASYRPSGAWVMMPLFVVLFYATRGERHEVEVSGDVVVLRKRLWPLQTRERRLLRGDVEAVLVEEYDDEARLVVQTRREKIPLTEAFYREKERIQRTQARLSELLTTPE